MAANSPDLSRRNMTAAMFGFTALAGGAVPPPSADIQLIAMGIEGRRVGEKHQRVTVDWWALKQKDPDIDRVAAELEISSDRMRELNEQALTLRATTPGGWQAKAELLRHFLLVECENKAGEMEFNNSAEELAWSLVCDMTGRAA